MIPDTKNNLPAMATVSAMQKCIRRGLEKQAMEFADGLMHPRSHFFRWCSTGSKSSPTRISTCSPHCVDRALSRNGCGAIEGEVLEVD